MRLAALHTIVLPLVLLYAPGSIAQSAPSGEARPARYVIADQDASGPGGSDMAALLVLLPSPKVNLLGITVVSGDSWRDGVVAHTLRLIELMGPAEVKGYPGAAVPLVRTTEGMNLPA